MPPAIKVTISQFHATADHAGLRLDQFLTAQIEDVSRARVQQLIEQGKVEVNGKHQRASYRIQGTETVEVTGPAQPPPLSTIPENIPLDVIYEDDSLAVINKPAGMMVHAGAGQSAENEDEEGDPRTRGTLVNALLYRFKKLSAEGGELRPGIVHRLDKDTSGLIVVAKTDSSHRKLAEQFAARVVKKKYLALVHGWPKKETGTINAPIGRDRVHRHRMSTRSRDGRDALSHYQVLKTYITHYGKFALVEVAIETGRTHQIRVHLASVGHAVVGDTLYGSPHAIAPLSSAYSRARPANTKATRDREATDIARQLTEQAMGRGTKPRAAKRTASMRTAATAAKHKPTEKSPKASIFVPLPLSLDRNFLHAVQLEFIHPKTGAPMRFSSPMPKELLQFLEVLENAAVC